MEETRLALVEALGVEGVGQPEMLVVEVVAELVEERAEKGTERDHSPPAGGAHPELDPGGAAAAPCRVEALELAPPAVWARAQDLEATGRDTKRLGQAGEELLGDRLDRGAILARQGGGEGGRQQAERPSAPEAEARDLVALAVDPLLRAGQPVIIRERHATRFTRCS